MEGKGTGGEKDQLGVVEEEGNGVEVVGKRDLEGTKKSVVEEEGNNGGVVGLVL